MKNALLILVAVFILGLCYSGLIYVINRPISQDYYKQTMKYRMEQRDLEKEMKALKIRHYQIAGAGHEAVSSSDLKVSIKDEQP